MAISVTNIGTAATVNGSSSVTLGSSVPSGAMILLEVWDQNTNSTPGTVTDAASNSYANVSLFNVTNFNVFAFYAANCLALSSSTTISYATHSPGHSTGISISYATGVNPTSPLDTSVTATNTGTGAASQPSLLTSGTPSVPNELFIAGLVAVGINTGGFSNYHQDTTNGWAAPPNSISLNSSGSTGFTLLGGGNQVASGAIGTEKYQPTFTFFGSDINTWYTYILGFTPPPLQGTAAFTGAGSLAASARMVLLAFENCYGNGALSAAAGLALANNSSVFGGTGSLSASALLAEQASVTFAGAGNLSALGTIQTLSSATFAGRGSFSANTIYLPAGSLLFILPGAGTFTASATLHISVAATFGGSGVWYPSPYIARQASAIFNGAGLLLIPLPAGVVLFFGAGRLTCNTIQLAKTAFFFGSGSLSADTHHNVSAVEHCNASSRMCATGFILQGRKGPTTNKAIAGPGATKNLVTAGGV